MGERLVRDAAIDVFRARGLTRMFANPGSTEVPLLVELPSDFEFVLGSRCATISPSRSTAIRSATSKTCGML